MANLFILPHFLGDTILTTGVINAFRDQPSVFVANNVTSVLLEGYPNIEEIIIKNKKPWKRHWLELWQELKNREWDTIIDLKGSVLPYFLKGKDKRFWKSPDGSCMKPVHVSKTLGFDQPLPPTLWLTPERIEKAKKKLKRPTLSVAPVANWVGKEWPMERYIDLLNLFCKTYPEAQVAVYAAPHEKEKAMQLINSLPKDQCLNTLGSDLMDSIALIKGSRLFLGNDSGLMHVSAAAGTPTIGLFGPSNEKIYGPYSNLTPSPHLTLRGEPFVKHVPQVREDTNCYMTALTVPMVWEGVKKIWER
jgi:ADP-heptose:LPS heptosyltransferase